MSGESCLVDSNILIRWVHPEATQFNAVLHAVRHLEDTSVTPCYTSQNLGEFWNVMTRPSDRNGYGFTPKAALVRAEQIEDKFRLLPDSLAVHLEWRRLLVAHSISGVQVHDARLVASMHVHNVRRILTFNTRDFARFTGIEAVHPADFANTAS